MARTLVVLTVLMGWTASARADGSIHVVVTDITVAASGDWELKDRNADTETWWFRADKALASVTFFRPITGEPCPQADHEDARIEYIQRSSLPNVTVKDYGLDGDVNLIGFCVARDGVIYGGSLSVPYKTNGLRSLFTTYYEPVIDVLQRYTDAATEGDPDAVVSSETPTRVVEPEPPDARDDAVEESPPSEIETSDDAGTAPTEVAAADPPSVPDQAEQLPGPEPAAGAPSLLSGLLPSTVLGAVVRRGDDSGSGFGFGLSLSRLTWREEQRRAIGYDVTVAAASQWWSVSAQLRPGVSTTMTDLVADAYLALGVDGTGGDAGPDVPFAPVGGVGFDVIAPLPVPFAIDLAAQVLVDPKGLHSYTLHGGLVFGEDGWARPRVGVSYVSHLDLGSVWLMTVGMTFQDR